MQAHHKRGLAVRPLPTEKPEQLALPGIPEPRYPLPVTVTATIKKHRYPLALAAVILFLYLIGQGTVATGLLFAVGLFCVNTLVDNQMGQGDE